jgi:5-methylcytosine-specific restriction endonuclease McrA
MHLVRAPEPKRRSTEKLAALAGLPADELQAFVTEIADELRTHGELPKNNAGGHELNQDQEKHLACFLRTKRAAEFRTQAVKAHSRVDSLEKGAEATQAKLDQVLTGLAKLTEASDRKRKDIVPGDAMTVTNFAIHEYHGFCPACPEKKTALFNEGRRSDDAHFDHFNNNRQDNQRDNFWLICSKCNQEKAGKISRARQREFHSYFDAYQTRLDKYDPPQPELADLFKR